MDVPRKSMSFQADKVIVDAFEAMLKAFSVTYENYYKEAVKSEPEEEAKNRATANLILMINGIDHFEETVAPQMKSDHDRDSFKGMLTSARVIKRTISGEVIKDDAPHVQSLSQEVIEHINKARQEVSNV